MTVSLSQCQPAALVTQLQSPLVSSPSALCCQTNPPQAKLDLISSQHGNLMAPHCVLKKDQTLHCGIQIPLQAPWNMPSQPRLCQPPSVLGCSAPSSPHHPHTQPRLSFPCTQLAMHSPIYSTNIYWVPTMSQAGLARGSGDADTDPALRQLTV